MDYSVGSYPPFEILKLVRRFPIKPFVLGSFVRMYGFVLGYWLREERPVSPEFIHFLRSEQKNALRKLFRLSPSKEDLPKSISSHTEPVSAGKIPSDKPPVSHNA